MAIRFFLLMILTAIFGACIDLTLFAFELFVQNQRFVPIKVK